MKNTQSHGRNRNPTHKPYLPQKCWVGEKAKIIYADQDAADLAARVAEYEHGLLAHSLKSYPCPFGNHYHLSRNDKLKPTSSEK